MTETIGLIGGTFDPIHFGHIHLAVMMKEAHHLDEVWFIPSLQNPLKKESGTPFHHRLKMVELAIKGIPYCKVLSIEGDRPPPSYTIDTVRELQKTHPDKKFHLLLGEDHLSSLDKWKDVNELLKLAPPYIAARYPLNESQMPVLEISSTMVRDRLKKGLCCKQFVPESVLDYIQQNRL